MSSHVTRAVLSGSFRRDITGLRRAYDELVTCGCQVLSPHRLDFKETETLFVRDQSEDKLSEEFLERHHLLSIKQSDFLWVHAPDGYIGNSTAFEVGYALANEIPIFSAIPILDPGIAPFVSNVASVFEAKTNIDPESEAI